MAEKKLRIPPQNIESEQALLGAIMMKPDSMHDIIDIVQVEDFYAEKHRMIYEAIMALFNRSEPIDLLSVSSRLKDDKVLEKIGGGSYLSELVNTTPAAANVTYYAELVRRSAVLRRLIFAGDHISELGYGGSGEIDEILDSAEKRIYEVTNVAGTRKFLDIKNLAFETIERIDHLHKSENQFRGIPTGFRDLDTTLSGLQKSDLIILAARPSMGKTAFALDIARQAAVQHNIPVGVFSLEMSAQQLVDRMLASEARVDAWKLRTGKLSTDEEFEQIHSALDRLSNAPIYIDDQPAATIISMRSVARRLKREKGLGLLVVDYLQLMAPTQTRASDSMVQQVTEISRSLKALARELDVPVLALSQLSRAVEQRRGRPRLSDLRDSGCLTGDTVLIDTKSGRRHTIRELAERPEQTPIKVLAANKDYTITPHSVSKVFHSGRKMVYRLKTRSGREIKASANHPFMRIDGWQQLDTLKAGDHIATPRSLYGLLPERKAEMDEKEIILLAHLLGDGCILPHQPYHYTNQYEENIETVRKAATHFGVDAKVVQQKRWYHLYLPSPYKLARGVHHPITLWYEKLGLSRVRSYEKRIPEKVLEAGSKQIALFLHHLWATDGNLSWKKAPGRRDACAIYYASTSHTLALQVQHLLLRLGVQSTLRTGTAKKGYRAIYYVQVEGAPNQIRFLETIGIADRRSKEIPAMLEALEGTTANTNTDTIPREAWRLVIATEKEKVGLSWRDVSEAMGVAYNGTALQRTGIGRSRMEVLSSIVSSPLCHSLATSDVLWDKIVSIEPLSVEDVYDATVPGVHNFVANDIVVHNSIEQDADVVMFIHREDKMQEDSGAEKNNIAEILIEKHRNGPVGKIDLFFDEKKATFLSVEKSNFGAFEGAHAEDF